MLQFVSEEKEIIRLNKRFFGQLNKSATRQTRIRLGFKGVKRNDLTVTAGYNSKLKFWWTNEEVFDHGKASYWNAFNIQPTPLIEDEKYFSRVNISYYKGGNSNSRSSRFAFDEEGNHYLVHSGSLRGGTEGLTKEFFWKYYTGESVFIKHGKRVLKYALVTDVESDSVAGNVFSFILQADRIKKIRAGEFVPRQTAPPATKKLASSEFWGDKSYNLPERHVEYTSDHGYVVDCLIKELEAVGYIAGRTKYIDVFIEDKNRFSHVFEIKTKLSRQSLYTAVGQLMIHGLSAVKKHKKIFVIPTGMDNELYSDLKALGIDVLTFTKKDLKVTFHELDSVL